MPYLFIVSSTVIIIGGAFVVNIVAANNINIIIAIISFNTINVFNIFYIVNVFTTSDRCRSTFVLNCIN